MTRLDPPGRATSPAEPMWAEPHPRRSPRGAAVATFGILVSGALVVAVFAYLISGFGVVGVAIAGLAALIPLAIVLLAIRWVDSWEPEPRSALAFAFLWGAGTAVAIALLFDLGLQLASLATGQPLPGDFTSAVVQAPVVEEVAKGLGVLLLLWFGRRHFDGPIDGLVYAATVAAGFAFTENILYFGRVLVEDGFTGGFVQTFILRGLFSPFAHVMFTACIGLALGLAAQRTGRFGALGWLLLGLVPAVLLHALWNGAASLVTDFISYYVVVQVPLFIGAVLLVVAVRRHERGVTRTHLAEYQEAGWFTTGEVELLSTWDGRRRAVAWADRQPRGVEKSAAMRRFVRDATRLAHVRHRIVRGRTGIGRPSDEQELLRAVSADRARILAP